VIEYPSIIASSKAPRANCVAFDKLDGSNIRAKWTQKRGFDVFGTRTQLIDENTAFWKDAVIYFKEFLAEPLDNKFRKDSDYRNEREIIVYGEYFGEHSFAGVHDETEKRRIIVFDVMTGHKNRRFVGPKEFIKSFGELIEIPRVVYEGNLNDQLIADVRAGKYGVNEGVVCKGTIRTGAARGGIWMAKIKTQAYFDRLNEKFGAEGIQKYGE